MKWKGRRASSNVEDARGRSSGAGAGVAGIGMLLNFVLRLFGMKGMLGASQKVNAMRGRLDFNQYSVRLELQADFYAGVWANHNRNYLEGGDIEDGDTFSMPYSDL